jgi:ubiquinone biosynthesis protein
MRAEAPLWAKTLPQLPRLLHRALSDESPRRVEESLRRIELVLQRQARILWVIALVLAALVVGYLLR